MGIRTGGYAYSLRGLVLRGRIGGDELTGDGHRFSVDVFQLVFLSRGRPNVRRLSWVVDRAKEIKLREMRRSARVVGGDLSNTLRRYVSTFIAGCTKVGGRRGGGVGICGGAAGGGPWKKRGGGGDDCGTATLWGCSNVVRTFW